MMYTRLQTEDFSVDEEKRLCVGDATGVGGISIFVGTVRDHAEGKKIVRMELTAYNGMAEKQLVRLRTIAMQKYDIFNITIVHRLGMLGVGDNIVCVVVASAHRGEAFKASAWAMDELKKTVPIWKKEFTEDGNHWVGSL